MAKTNRRGSIPDGILVLENYNSSVKHVPKSLKVCPSTDCQKHIA